MKRYEIKTLEDICERLADRDTRDDFRADFNSWMDAFCEEDDRLRALVEKTKPKSFKHTASFVWVDDNKRGVSARSLNISLIFRPPGGGQ